MFSKLQTVLVALDNSPRAPSVLEAAIDLAKLSGAELVLFRGVGLPLDLPHDALGVSPSNVPQILERHAREELDKLLALVPEGVRARVVVRPGVPWESICHASRDVNADLIVIGSHGFSGLDRILGTTAARVVNHADRTVVVVRDRPR